MVLLFELVDFKTEGSFSFKLNRFNFFIYEWHKTLQLHALLTLS